MISTLYLLHFVQLGIAYSAFAFSFTFHWLIDILINIQPTFRSFWIRVSPFRFGNWALGAHLDHSTNNSNTTI